MIPDGGVGDGAGFRGFSTLYRVVTNDPLDIRQDNATGLWFQYPLSGRDQ